MNLWGMQGLIRLLSTCASGSPLGAKTLLLLGISGILKDILAGAGISTNASVSPALSRPAEQVLLFLFLGVWPCGVVILAGQFFFFFIFTWVLKNRNSPHLFYLCELYRTNTHQDLKFKQLKVHALFFSLIFNFWVKSNLGAVHKVPQLNSNTESH